MELAVDVRENDCDLVSLERPGIILVDDGVCHMDSLYFGTYVNALDEDKTAVVAEPIGKTVTITLE